MPSITPAMELVMTLSSLQAQILKRVDQRLSVHGISFTEFMVMYRLNGAPKKAMRRIDLAESVGLTASGVTRLLNPMEKMHLVQKELNPRDARVSLVKLSKAGEQILNDATVTFQQSAEMLTQPMDAKQIAKLLELTKALL